MVLPNPSKESVKTAAASEIATATIASERFVQRRGGVVLPEIGMLAAVHAPFHGEAGSLRGLASNCQSLLPQWGEATQSLDRAF
jgi:hypothetical protein